MNNYRQTISPNELSPSRFAKTAWMLGLFGILCILVGCTDSDSETFSDVDVVGRNVNPEGIAYPSDDWGMRPIRGKTRGQRLPNLSFSGYPKSNVADGLKIVSFADYYDPNQLHSKLLIVVGVSLYCPHCQAETRAIVASDNTLRRAGVEIIEVAFEGSVRGRSLVLKDVNNWVDKMNTGFTVVIDAAAKRFVDYATIDAVPWNVRVDPRSMEVLSIEPGELLDFDLYAEQGLSWIATHDPRP